MADRTSNTKEVNDLLMQSFMNLCEALILYRKANSTDTNAITLLVAIRRILSPVTINRIWMTCARGDDRDSAIMSCEELRDCLKQDVGIKKSLIYTELHEKLSQAMQQVIERETRHDTYA